MRTVPGNFNILVTEVSKLLSPVAIFLLHPFSEVQAQQETDYAVHANIIYHFTKYIDWPDNKKSGKELLFISLYHKIITYETQIKLRTCH
jgi:hypothetical protein